MNNKNKFTTLFFSPLFLFYALKSSEIKNEGLLSKNIKSYQDTMITILM